LTPDIACNIPKLHVYIVEGETRPDGSVDVKVKVWFVISSLLPDIFEMFPFLEVFHWGNVRSLTWDDLSSQLRLASLKLFQSSSLTTIILELFHGLPFSRLHLSPVKKLVFDVQLHDRDSERIVLPQLETLQI
jgi:hypothetical protein